MAPYDETANEFGGAKWQYLAANVRKKSDGTYALPDVAASPGTSDGGTWMTTVGGVNVGFVGTVTEELPALVSPAGIADVVVSDIVDETNQAADALKTAGADIVIMLVHEGATTTNIASLSDGSAFAQIVAGVDADVDAIISGHTHLAYNHADPNADTLGRPVVSSGQYGTNLNKLVFTVDTATDTVTLNEKSIVAAATLPLTAQSAIDKKAEVQGLVDAAKTEADVLGAVKLGELSGPFNRARLSTGSENRGGESTLGNLVAEVQRWATSAPEAGAAQIAFMNPGGLREDMLGLNAEGYPADLTYKQAAVVQPFANTLINMQMTGAQIKTVLEQQWQPSAASRPFLRLGTSAGFKFTYDSTLAAGSRITGMWLNGTPIGLATSYSVTANSFLASGGDNFGGFNAATGKRDTGKVDLQAMVDYMAANSPVAVDPKQHAIGVSFPAESPAVYHPGEHVRFSVYSWAFTGTGDPKDDTVTVLMDGDAIATLPVDNSRGTAVFDDYGKITGDVTIPVGTPPGIHTMSIVGDTTGTTLDLPSVETDRAPIKSDSMVQAVATPATIKAQTGTSVIDVTVSTPGAKATGLVAALLDGAVIGGAELVDGKASIKVGPFASAGEKLIEVTYYGDQGTKPSSGQVRLTVEPAPVVEKATPTITASISPDTVQVNKDGATASVSVTRTGGAATGAVLALVDGKVVGAGELVAGKAEIALQPFTEVGDQTVTVKYFGDEATKAGQATDTVTVTKARPKLTLRGPKKVASGSKATFKVTVLAGYMPSGKVTLKVAGKTVTKKLRDGMVTFKVRLTKSGKHKVKVRYSGDALNASTGVTKAIRVLR